MGVTRQRNKDRVPSFRPIRPAIHYADLHRARTHPDDRLDHPPECAADDEASPPDRICPSGSARNAVGASFSDDSRRSSAKADFSFSATAATAAAPTSTNFLRVSIEIMNSLYTICFERECGDGVSRSLDGCSQKKSPTLPSRPRSLEVDSRSEQHIPLCVRAGRLTKRRVLQLRIDGHQVHSI